MNEILFLRIKLQSKEKYSKRKDLLKVKKTSLNMNIKYDNPFGVLIEKEELIYIYIYIYRYIDILSETGFDAEIIEGILDCVERANELRISSLFKEFIKVLNLLSVHLRKISSNHFEMQLSEGKFVILGKQNPRKLTVTFLELERHFQFNQEI